MADKPNPQDVIGTIFNQDGKVIALDAGEWKRFLRAMRNPGEPTKAILDGAELLRKTALKKAKGEAADDIEALIQKEGP